MEFILSRVGKPLTCFKPSSFVARLCFRENARMILKRLDLSGGERSDERSM